MSMYIQIYIQKKSRNFLCLTKNFHHNLMRSHRDIARLLWKLLFRLFKTASFKFFTAFIGEIIVSVYLGGFLNIKNNRLPISSVIIKIVIVVFKNPVSVRRYNLITVECDEVSF